MYNNNINMAEVEEYALNIKKALETIYNTYGDKLPISTSDEETAFNIVVNLLKGNGNINNQTITALKMVGGLITKYKNLRSQSNTLSNNTSLFGNNVGNSNVGFGSGVSNSFMNNLTSNNSESNDDSFISLPETETSVKQNTIENVSLKKEPAKPEVTVDNVNDFYEAEDNSIFKPLIDESKYFLSYVIKENGKFEYRIKEKGE